MGQQRGLLTWSVYASIAIVSMTQGVLGPLLPLIGADMPMSHTVESYHITGLAAGGFFIALVMEPLRARTGRWGAILVALLIGLIAAVLLNQAVNPAMTVAATTLLGIAVSGVLIPGQTILVARHMGRGAKFIGEANVAFAVGAVAATSILPVMVTWWGWRSFPLLQMVLLSGLAIPLLFAARTEAQSIPERDLTDPDRPAQAARRPAISYVAMCAGVVVEWSLVFWLPTYFANITGLSEVVSASMSGWLFVAMMVSRYVGSGVMNRVQPGVVLVVSAIVTIGTVVLLFLTTNQVMATTVALLVGAAVANLYPAGMALVVAAHPATADRAVAKASTLVSLSVIISPLVLGSLADAVGLTRAFFVVPVIAVGTMIAVKLTGANSHTEQSVISGG